MASKWVPDERVTRLNDQETASGRYLLYWMQQSQRAEGNPALEFAIQRANAVGQPLVVGFGLTADYPAANRRHFQFMLEGLQGVESALQRRGIRFLLRIGDPAEVATALGRDAGEVICDFGPLRHQRAWRSQVARAVPGTCWQVEGDSVVPLRVASEKREYAARTIRSKINDRRATFLHALRTTPLEQPSLEFPLAGESLRRLDVLLEKLSIDDTVPPVETWTAGTVAARRRLRRFIDEELTGYDQASARPDAPQVSQMSPYLHFGQVSPRVIALEIEGAASAGKDDRAAYLEELLVRRELAQNFVFYTDDYDQFSSLPDWCQETLAAHRDDPREYVYAASELEAGQTHDPVWNAAMQEMRSSGYLHNHLRMYWGKKILEWTNTPEHAYRTALMLNNKYFLDGRDANSFANVGWLFGLHDRPHQERPVYGKIRYMSAAGLHRKFAVDRYLDEVERRTGPVAARGETD